MHPNTHLVGPHTAELLREAATAHAVAARLPASSTSRTSRGRTAAGIAAVLTAVVVLAGTLARDAGAQVVRTSPPGGGPPTRAEVARELAGVAGALGGSRALPRTEQRRLAGIARRSRTAVRRARVCPAAQGLRSIHTVLSRRQRTSRGAPRRALQRLAARNGRVLGRVLALAPSGKGCGGAPIFTVDPLVEPDAGALPELGGRKRPLARIVDGYGRPADFVADELVVLAPPGSELDRVRRRWSGTVLKTIDLPGAGADLHLLRVDPSSADPADFPAHVQKLTKTRGSSAAVSSVQGLELLAAAATEAARGAKVGANFVGAGSGFGDGQALDAPTGPAGFSLDGPGWTRNAHRWTHLGAGGPMDTGVAPSWALLHNLDRLRPRSVKLAVLDMGFDPLTNSDFPAPFTALSNVPFTRALGTPNLASCTGGQRCPWHGTGVLNAATAVVDNGVGAAGTGGPVADAVAVFTSYDMFSGISALTQAYAAGARIANMSYGAPVPASVSFVNTPFDHATLLFRALGMSMYAAAGNEMTDVDAEDCFGACWEETWFTPCENAGVTCVGATATNSRAPACYSNWGDRDVDLWAPGTVLLGSDPTDGGNIAKAVMGTSVASPWTAGVAALGSAAGADAGRVETALRARARRGGTQTSACDGTPAPTRTATRFVDALATIRDILARQLVITAPAEGTSHRRGVPVRFSAFLFDDGEGPAPITWTLDGEARPIATGASFLAGDLPYGRHTLTATATFPDGRRVSDSVAITITNDAPAVAVNAPLAGSTHFRTATLAFRATSTDINEPGGRLPDSGMSWYLDGDTAPFARGHDVSRSLADLAPGPHTARVRGTDGAGSFAEATVTFTVLAPPLDPAPTVAIVRPANDSSFQPMGRQGAGWYADVSFDTTATDPGGQQLTYTWTDRIDGGAPVTLPATVADPVLRLGSRGLCATAIHDITVTVSDGTSRVSDTKRVRVTAAPC